MAGKLNQYKDLRLTYSAPAGLSVYVLAESVYAPGVFSIVCALTFPATLDPESYTLPLDLTGALESTLVKFEFVSTGPVRLLDGYLRWRPIGVFFQPGKGEVWEMQDLYLGDPHHFREVELVLEAQLLYCDVSTELPNQNVQAEYSTMLTTLEAAGRLPVNFRLSGEVTGRLLRVRLYLPVDLQGLPMPAKVFAGRVYARKLGSSPAADWAWIPLPIEPTTQDWLTAKLPIGETPPEYSWLSIPMDEVA